MRFDGALDELAKSSGAMDVPTPVPPEEVEEVLSTLRCSGDARRLCRCGRGWWDWEGLRLAYVDKQVSKRTRPTEQVANASLRKPQGQAHRDLPPRRSGKPDVY